MPQGPLGERIPFEGVLNCWNDDHDLPDLLLAISRSGKTGRLHFSNPEGDKTLDLRAGKVVFAESSSQDDGLGQFLLRTGQISLMDYTRVSKMVQPGKRLGALLVDEHVLHEENLIPAVIGQVRSVILSLFRRTESWYCFKEQELEQKESITLDLAVPELILEGVHYVESWRRISKGVGNLESVYQQTATLESEWSSSELGDDVRELITMLASPTSLTEICEHASLPDFEACRYLWAFRTLGWIDLVDTAADVEATTNVADAATPAPTPVETPVPATVETPPANSAQMPVMDEPKPIHESLVETQFSIETDLAPPSDQETAPPADAPKPTPIPESLIQTQISVMPPKQPDKVTTAPSVPAPATPKIPEHLNETQLSVEPPAATPSKPPKAIPDELLHTQMFVESPSAPPPANDEPALPRSTGEFMESILEGETPPSPTSLNAAPEPPTPPPFEPPSVSTPEPAPPAAPVSHETTQFFDGPSALTPNDAPEPAPASAAELSSSPASPPAPAPEPATATEPAASPSGFEALALGDDLGSPSTPSPAPQNPAPPNPADVATQPSVQPAPPAPQKDAEMASFSDLALSDAAIAEPPPAPDAPLPLVEADAVDVEPAYVPGEPLLPQSRGTEITQKSLIPPRRRADDVNLDEGLGHTLGVDKK